MFEKINRTNTITPGQKKKKKVKSNTLSTTLGSSDANSKPNYKT